MIAAVCASGCGGEVEGRPDAGGVEDARPPGRTFYIAVDGDDGSDGSASAPFGSFGHALGVLRAGDTLIVKDGEYGPNTGTDTPNIDCSSDGTSCGGEPCEHGTPDAPITVRAENERRALLRTLGERSALRMDMCDYWTIEGLRAEHGDNPAITNNPQVVYVVQGEGVTLRRLIVRQPNRYGNNHGIWAGGNTRLTIEECEVLDFTRNGISVHGGSFDVIRRNYVHSRRTPNLADGYNCCCLETGDEGILLGGEYRAIVENNIVEEVCGGYAVLITSYIASTNGPLQGDAVRLLGNVARAVGTGVRGYSECEMANPCTADLVVTDMEVVDTVVIDSSVGFRSGGTERSVFRELTSIDASSADYRFDVYSENAGMASLASTFVLNTLDFGAGDYAYTVSGLAEWSIVRTNSFGNGAGDFSGSDGNVSEHTSVDPGMSGCYVYVPSGSPMKGAGVDGRDIGANVVHRYENGRLTSEPLWDPETGQFPCGAVIEGVNDDSMESCINAHERLHVGTEGCPIPR